MMQDAKLDQISAKMDDLSAAQNSLKVSMAKQQTHHENSRRTMDRFWDSTWPEVIEKIDGNSTKIVTLEVDIARIKTMVMLWGSLVTVLVALSVPFITYFLDKKP
jgi:hypothetical protein